MLSLPSVQSSFLHLHPPAAFASPPLFFSNLKTNFDSTFVPSPDSQFFVHNRCLHRRASVSLMAKSPKTDSSEQKWSHEGSVVESLPNGMFRVRLDNEDLILGYISGKIRKNFVRILPGDRVRVEVVMAPKAEKKPSSDKAAEEKKFVAEKAPAEKKTAAEEKKAEKTSAAKKA